MRVPADLSNENIQDAQTNDASVNQQLRGKLFLRPEISNKQPWVGEPVILSYWIYNGGLSLSPLKAPENEQVPSSVPGQLASSVAIRPPRNDPKREPAILN